MKLEEGSKSNFGVLLRQRESRQ